MVSLFVTLFLEKTTLPVMSQTVIFRVFSVFIVIIPFDGFGEIEIKFLVNSLVFKGLATPKDLASDAPNSPPSTPEIAAPLERIVYDPIP